MAKRLNFTGRQKILRKDARIRIQAHPGDLSFTAALNLDDYKLDPDASVYVEAFRSVSTLWKRFDFGRVARIQPPADSALNEFVRPEGILFRVKVTGADGRLLAEADQVRPLLPDDADQENDALISIVPSKSLGVEIWKVDFSDDTPQLLINDLLEDWKDVARDQRFRSLVTPVVMRQVLIHMLLMDGGIGEEDDPTCWQQKWLLFAGQLPGVSECPGVWDEKSPSSSRSEVEEWIEEAVKAFCATTDVLQRFCAARLKEEEP